MQRNKNSFEYKDGELVKINFEPSEKMDEIIDLLLENPNKTYYLTYGKETTVIFTVEEKIKKYIKIKEKWKHKTIIWIAAS